METYEDLERTAYHADFKRRTALYNDHFFDADKHEADRDEARAKMDVLLSNMKESVIDNDECDVYVTCPECDNCEGHPIGEQRHHLQWFEIIDWLPSEEEVEISVMKCYTCKEEFKLRWAYK